MLFVSAAATAPTYQVRRGLRSADLNGGRTCATADSPFPRAPPGVRPEAKSTRLSDENGTVGNVGTSVNIYFRPMKSSHYRDSKGQSARARAKCVAFWHRVLFYLAPWRTESSGAGFSRRTPAGRKCSARPALRPCGFSTARRIGRGGPAEVLRWLGSRRGRAIVAPTPPCGVGMYAVSSRADLKVSATAARQEPAPLEEPQGRSAGPALRLFPHVP